MGKITEEIDDTPEMKSAGSMKFIKRMFSRQRRKQAKDYCYNFDENMPEPEIKNHYEGWTT